MALIFFIVLVPTAIAALVAFVIFIVLMEKIIDYKKVSKKNRRTGREEPSDTAIWVLTAVLIVFLFIVFYGVMFMKTFIFDVLWWI